MAIVKDIYSFLDQIAPVRYQMDFDNSGFLVGDADSPVSTVLIALDITDDVISEAEDSGAQLIISHHPMIFHALKKVRTDDLTGRKVLRLARRGISAICMHTNLDIADEGVNDALMKAIDADVSGILEPTGIDEDGSPLGCGRVGTLCRPMPLKEFLPFLSERLHVSGLRYCGETDVSRIAVCGGSGGNLLEFAFEAGCDTLVTADVKYDRFLAAKELGMNLIDADHFCTENVIIPVIAEKIRRQFPELDIRISQRLGQTAQIYMP